MKAARWVSALLVIAIFLQLVLGGLLSSGIVSQIPHIAVGFIVLAIAVASTVISFKSVRRSKLSIYLSAFIVAAIIVQIFMGFAVLDYGNPALITVHLVLATVILVFAIIVAFLIRAQSTHKSQTVRSLDGGGEPET